MRGSGASGHQGIRAALCGCKCWGSVPPYEDAQHEAWLHDCMHCCHMLSVTDTYSGTPWGYHSPAMHQPQPGVHSPGRRPA